MLLLLKWNHCLCKVKTFPDGQNIQTNVLICGDTFRINIDQFGWFSGRKHSPRRKSNFVELVNSNVSGTNFDISGTFCAAAKIGIFNNGCYCQFPKTLKASGNWKIQPESFAASFTLPSPQIESINSDGSNRRTILTAKNRINRPTAMAIMDRWVNHMFPSDVNIQTNPGVSTTWIPNTKRLSALIFPTETTPKLCSTMKWSWGRWTSTGSDRFEATTPACPTRAGATTSASLQPTTSEHADALLDSRREPTMTPIAIPTALMPLSPSFRLPEDSASRTKERPWCQFLVKVRPVFCISFIFC